MSQITQEMLLRMLREELDKSEQSAKKLTDALNLRERFLRQVASGKRRFPQDLNFYETLARLFAIEPMNLAGYVALTAGFSPDQRRVRTRLKELGWGVRDLYERVRGTIKEGYLRGMVNGTNAIPTMGPVRDRLAAVLGLELDRYYTLRESVHRECKTLMGGEVAVLTTLVDAVHGALPVEDARNCLMYEAQLTWVQHRLGLLPADLRFIFREQRLRVKEMARLLSVTPREVLEWLLKAERVDDHLFVDQLRKICAPPDALLSTDMVAFTEGGMQSHPAT
ncbi:MAG: hypothetical protein VKO21_10950 [Candidatus Sericytochromatia bacterium]|nr:hypothetical protein [Candidatus Sericytochromatia bacterium]